MLDHTVIFGIFTASAGMASSPDGRPVFHEPAFFRSLGEAALRLGVMLYVFARDGWHSEAGELYAYHWQNGDWRRLRSPLPDIVYDRAFYVRTADRLSSAAALAQIRAVKPHIRLNGNLPTKLEVYRALRQDAGLASLLPATELCTGSSLLEQWLKAHPEGVLLKPAAGMQGRGVIHMKRDPQCGAVSVSGRTLGNTVFAKSFPDRGSWLRWTEHRLRQAPHAVQPYLQLRTLDGHPFDIRALMQKNERGRWALTGIAARRGLPNGLTSNLHGGGEAARAFGLLCANFGKPVSERLLEQIHTISEYTAEMLESRFGRFAELGFDFGVEQDGKLWLLEANSKPGRSSLRLIGDEAAFRQSIERPIMYARLLSRGLTSSPAVHESANGREAPNDRRQQLRQRPFNVQEVHR